MQLDIFEHSREVMLRNDAARALERRDASAALQACERLAQEFPADESLPGLRVLTGYIEGAEVGRQDAFFQPRILARDAADLAGDHPLRGAAHLWRAGCHR